MSNITLTIRTSTQRATVARYWGESCAAMEYVGWRIDHIEPYHQRAYPDIFTAFANDFRPYMPNGWVPPPMPKKEYPECVIRKPLPRCLP